MQKVYTLAVWGPVVRSGNWGEWLEFMDETAKAWGAPLSKCDIKSPGSEKSSQRSAQSISKLIAEVRDKEIVYLSGVSLPKKYVTRVFDYQIDFHRCQSDRFAAVSVKEDFAGPLRRDPKAWLDKLGQFNVRKKGLLFESDKDECAYMYVAGATPARDFESLKVLKRWGPASTAKKAASKRSR